MTQPAEIIQRLRETMARVIVAQDEVVEETIVALMAGGHVLLEGVPGLAKTLLARCLSQIIDARYARIQFTPDLMPGDVCGANIFNMNEGRFQLVKGPIFTNVLLADEINRTPPKTQSALLEAMEERQVTIDGKRHTLDGFFFVMATQNPIEYEGTYPLPEAQVDRFLLKIIISYPQPNEEAEILRRHHAGLNPSDLESLNLPRLLTIDQLNEARAAIRQTRVDESIFDYIVRLTAASRRHHLLTLGGSPRASLALMQTSKVVAVMRGRDFVTPDDVKRMAPSVLRHRVILKPEARIEGLAADDIVEQLLADTEVPR